MTRTNHGGRVDVDDVDDLGAAVGHREVVFDDHRVGTAGDLGSPGLGWVVRRDLAVVLGDAAAFANALREAGSDGVVRIEIGGVVERLHAFGPLAAACVVGDEVKDGLGRGIDLNACDFLHWWRPGVRGGHSGTRREGVELPSVTRELGAGPMPKALAGLTQRTR